MQILGHIFSQCNRLNIHLNHALDQLFIIPSNDEVRDLFSRETRRIPKCSLRAGGVPMSNEREVQ